MHLVGGGPLVIYLLLMEKENVENVRLTHFGL